MTLAEVDADIARISQAMDSIEELLKAFRLLRSILVVERGKVANEVRLLEELKHESGT